MSVATIECCDDFAKRINRLVITHIPEAFKLRLGAFDANSLIDPQFGRKPWQSPEVKESLCRPINKRGSNVRRHQPV